MTDFHPDGCNADALSRGKIGRHLRGQSIGHRPLPVEGAASTKSFSRGKQAVIVGLSRPLCLVSTKAANQSLTHESPCNTRGLTVADRALIILIRAGRGDARRTGERTRHRLELWRDFACLMSLALSTWASWTVLTIENFADNRLSVT